MVKSKPVKPVRHTVILSLMVSVLCRVWHTSCIHSITLANPVKSLGTHSLLIYVLLLKPISFIAVWSFSNNIFDVCQITHLESGRLWSVCQRQLQFWERKNVVCWISWCKLTKLLCFWKNAKCLWKCRWNGFDIPFQNNTNWKSLWKRMKSKCIENIPYLPPGKIRCM